ncbi:MAG: sulfite exporter TauE/SafE family protein [Bacteroidia bacterium]|nr:sulfite exporter TauE/SafE family protein [Bacteroidia bacterium]
MEALSNPFYLLLVLLPLAAFLYASVGHGGASSYIALLTLFEIIPAETRPAALILNIGVSGIAFISFYKRVQFPKSLFLSLILFSIPASFAGGLFLLDAHIYKKVLGVLLLFPTIRLLNIFSSKEIKPIERKIWMAPLLGLAIGFVSGLIGIGGGIILSPIILFLGWTDLKQTAAVSALFIFLNSISGLIGISITGFHLPDGFEWMIPITLFGGFIGGYAGANKFNSPAMRISLAVVLAVASIKFILF